MDRTFIFGLVNIFIAFSCIYMTALCSVKRNYTKAYSSLKYFSLTNSIVSLFYGIYYIYPSLEVDSYLLSIIHAVRPYVALSFFFFVYAINYPKKSNKKLFFALLIVPLVISGLSLTFKYHSLFITYSSRYYYTPFRNLKETYHVFFYIYMVYNYIVILLSISLLFVHIMKLSSHKKNDKVHLSIVIALYASNNIFAIFTNCGLCLWIEVISALATVYMIYYTLYDNEERKIKEEGEKELIDKHPFPIVLQNSSDKIVYANSEAMRVCPRLLDFKTKDHYYDEIYDCFSFYSLKEEITNKSFNTNIKSILQKKDSGDLFFIHTTQIYDKDKQTIGKLHMLVAVSDMMEFLNNLENHVFKDGMCNVYNSYYLNMKEDEYSKEKFLPMSILRVEILDYNDVKEKFGQKECEEYVMLCVFILKQELRKEDMIFRLKEGEFIVVLPNTPRRTLNNMTKAIVSKQTEYKKFSKFSLNIKFGRATSQTIPLDFEEMRQKAKNDNFIDSKIEEGEKEGRE